MSDLIDRQALIAEYDRVHVGAPGGARKLMVDAPTIEERKRGRWERRIVDNGFNADWVCSECKYRVKTDFVNYNFCPNCGADMRGNK